MNFIEHFVVFSPKAIISLFMQVNFFVWNCLLKKKLKDLAQVKKTVKQKWLISSFYQ